MYAYDLVNFAPSAKRSSMYTEFVKRNNIIYNWVKSELMLFNTH